MRKSKVLYFGLAVCLLVSIFALGCAGPAAPKEVVVRLTGHMPIGHITTEAHEKMIAKAEELSGGTLKFEYYPAGQLYKDMRALEAIQNGEIEIAAFFLTRSGGLIPSSLFENPWYDLSELHARRLFDVQGGGDLFYSVLKPKFAEQGLLLMPGPLYGQGMGTICEVPIYKLEDFEGLKIRVNGPVMGGMVEAFGASPVVMPSSDAYMAIQRGTIDGAGSGSSSFISRKWYEVADYVQLHVVDGAEILYYLVNPDFWQNTLNADQRDAIVAAMRETTIWTYERAPIDEKEQNDALGDAGLEVYEFPSDEFQRIKDAGWVGLERVVKPLVTEEEWSEHVRTYEAGEKSTRSVRDILESCDWY